MITVPQEVKDALLLLDTGQQFALCNFHHDETRRDVKNLRPHIDVIRNFIEDMQKPKCQCGARRWWDHYVNFIDDAGTHYADRPCELKSSS